MAYRVTSEGYSPFFREQEDVPESTYEDGDDGYTCALCNTSYEKDLQLAAELGKTLLERNKELEAALRQHQNLVDDQEQEIEYLRKQTQALREVNDSRLRIYEQLEVSIGELETNNNRLTAQSTTDKKTIKGLESQIDRLESRCEELERRVSVEEELRRERCEEKEIEKKKVKPIPMSPLIDGRRGEEGFLINCGDIGEEELNRMREENSRLNGELKNLKEFTDCIIQEKQKLEERLISMDNNLKQLEQEETNQPKKFQIEACPRCLRTQDDWDEDDVSIIGSIMNDDHLVKECLLDPYNPYRTLVEKYEALCRVQRGVPGFYRPHNPPEGEALSLQQELEMSGAFFNREEEDDEEEDVKELEKVEGERLSGSISSKGEDSGVGGGNHNLKRRSGREGASQTEPSETSSGFADETASKSTQTEYDVVSLPPGGSFLCSITDGDDCKFSIYDEANAVDSRFRKTPEYRRLFREIFDVLKRAAEAKDEGESLPLLEDMTPICETAPKAPPVTPTGPGGSGGGGGGDEEKEKGIGRDEERRKGIAEESGGEVMRRRKGEGQTDALAAAGNRGRRKRRSSKHRQESPSSLLSHHNLDNSSSVNGVLIVGRSGRKKRSGDGGWRSRGSDSGRSTPEAASIGRGSKRGGGGVVWGPVSSSPAVTPPTPIEWFMPSGSASKEVAKLKQLEKSYAEVLRLGRENMNRK